MANASSSRPDVYQLVTDIILEKLEQGVIPWKQRWSAQGPAANYLTRKPYRGINALLLNTLGLTQPYFLTFRQAKQLGGYVRKGAQSLPVVFWQWYYRHRETGKKLTEQEVKALPDTLVERHPFLRYYRVFHISDTERITFELPTVNLSNPDEDKLMCGFQPLHSMPHPVAVKTRSNMPFYHPQHDYINMPAMNTFSSEEAFFQVLYHEMTHATGHAKRLNRSSVTAPQPFGSWTYSKEELVAEMGASFLSNLMGLQNEAELGDAASYIQGWLKVLRNDKRFVVEAAQQAQRAVDYILGKSGESP
ncbi:MAG: zincin-like metallopeptidase domain-containing protein [Bacteroidota bacterium]